MRRTITRRLWLASLLTLGLTGCANEVTDFLIEQPLGKLSELAINLQFRMERDPLLFGYNYLLGEECHQLVRRKNVPYRFNVVLLEEPNAFAIPWGGVYVTKGLMRFVDGEDELAFILGHEIGHVERRHSSLAFQRNLLVTIGLQLISNRKNEDLIQFAYLGNQFLDLHWSRQNEHSADMEGAMYAVLSGHDPAAGIDFFQKLDARYGATPRFWSYFQTHPINRDRISEVLKQPYLAEDPQMLCRIADGYARRGLNVSAESHYARAVAADPNHGQGYLGLARVATWRGDYQVARQQYLDAVKHGVEMDAVEPELDRLPEENRPRQGDVLLASAADVQAATGGLQALNAAVDQTNSLGEPVWRDPLYTSTALVQGYTDSGSLLDALYGRSDQLPESYQQLVTVGQKLRAAAMRGASDLGAAQEQAEDTVALIESNRARILAKLGDQPTAAELEVARAVLVDSERALREVQDGIQRLNEVRPRVQQTVTETYQAIELLHRNLASGARIPGGVSRLAEQLQYADQRIANAFELAARPQQAIYDGRARGLESSIDITLVDRPGYERESAQRVMARMLLCEPNQVREAVDSGLSYGETAYVLGMAASADEEPREVQELARYGGLRQTVDRLSRRERGRTDNVVIMLQLIDRTLRREFEPATY